MDVELAIMDMELAIDDQVYSSGEGCIAARVRMMDSPGSMFRACKFWTTTIIEFDRYSELHRRIVEFHKAFQICGWYAPVGPPGEQKMHSPSTGLRNRTCRYNPLDILAGDRRYQIEVAVVVEHT